MAVRVLSWLVVCLSVVARSSGATPPVFEKDVLPILSRYCLSCHGAAAQTAGLDLRTPALMMKGGSKGTALVKGSAVQSLLYTRIADKSMPFGPKKLTDGEVKIVREWIESGARGESSEPSTTRKSSSSHWAFQPPVRPAIPQVRDRAWVRTPVDAFILAALERKGIPAPAAAANGTLLRRVYLDTIGLPPSPDESRAYLESRDADSFTKLVDKLLDRPQYGERWARRWLDVVRYAESNGYERDGAKPHAWRYRDYVINSFNQDKPFDRFVTEQLAGDEVEGANAETRIATTFLRLGTWDDEPGDPALDRYDQLDDIVGATSAAFLGLTLRCARCHDHKFEPFPQKDYYRFMAVFAPLKRPQEARNDLDRFVGTDSELASYRERTAKADAEVSDLKKQQEEVNQAVLKRLFAGENGAADLAWMQHAETVLAFRAAPDKRTKRQKELVEKFEERLNREIYAAAVPGEQSKLTALKTQIDAINSARPKEPLRAYVLYEDSAKAAPVSLLLRGDPSQLGEQVESGAPTVLPALDAGPLTPTSQSTGRRLWLARWLTHPGNPLLARVIVNRLWQWHFGDGLVASENDFGVMGQQPSNQELLDYLATELIRSGWSLKHIQRLILNSSTFRASSGRERKAGEADPENTLQRRWTPRRLEAEIVRDAMLAVSGELNLEVGGPSVYPKLPREVLEGQSRPGEGWGASDARETLRRSVYIFSKRSLGVPELELLDAPDTTSSCEQRDVSTTGPQALTFLNGEFARARARHFADRLVQEAGPESGKQITRAFQLALGRLPNREELRSSLDFLKQVQTGSAAALESDATPQVRALQAFCLVLLNSNEFFYVE